MISSNDKISAGGSQFVIGDMIDRGGEATVFQAREDASGRMVAVKLFHNCDRPREKRTRWLVERHADLRICPAINSPSAIFYHNGQFGHVSDFVSGQNLDTWLSQPKGLADSMALAAAVAFAVAVAEGVGIAIGDISTSNVLVRTHPSLSVHLIDLDNFSASGAPRPQMAGQYRFMAPEVRVAMATGKPSPVGLMADRFSLAALLHELLLKQPAAGTDPSPEDFASRMASGKWQFDPDVEDPRHSGPVSSKILSTPIRALFRRGFSLNPEARPSAREWCDVLTNELARLFLHKKCGGAWCANSRETTCPVCRLEIRYRFEASGQRRPVVVEDGTVIGRIHLSQSHDPRHLPEELFEVSSSHAEFKREGPLLFVVPKGSNGTFTMTGSGAWRLLPQGRPFLVQDQSKLRFARVPGVIIED